MRHLILCILTFVLIISARSTYGENEPFGKKDLPGVIMVPGDGGAQLQAHLNKSSTEHYYCDKTSDWFTAWLNYFQMVPGIINCWLSNMVLQYDNTTRTTHSPDGVVIRVPGFGDTATVEYLTDDRLYSYFAYVAETLVSLGYERNVNLKGAPFDFRKAPNELSPFFSELKLVIESLRLSTGGPVVIISHSMGSPLINYFLNQQTEAWRKENIENLISLAGAWGGAVKAVKVYAAGDNLGSVLSSLTLRTQQRTNPSLAFLLPDPALWGDEVLVVAPKANYTIHDMKEYLLDLKLTDAYEMYLDTRNLLSMSTTPPHVPLHCLYGVGVATVERIEYASEAYFPDYPRLVNGPGDGTVNLRSAALCQQYASLQQELVQTEVFNNTDHMAILSNSGVLRYIAGAVTAVARGRAEVDVPSLEPQQELSGLDSTSDGMKAGQGGITEADGSLSPGGGKTFIVSRVVRSIDEEGPLRTRVEGSQPEFVTQNRLEKRSGREAVNERTKSFAGLTDETTVPSSEYGRRASKTNSPVTSSSVSDNTDQDISALYHGLNIDAIKARVDSAISARWREAVAAQGAYSTLRQIYDIEQEMERKMLQAQDWDLTIGRLRRRMHLA